MASFPWLSDERLMAVETRPVLHAHSDEIACLMSELSLSELEEPDDDRDGRIRPLKLAPFLVGQVERCAWPCAIHAWQPETWNP